jgi:hypothetical protein
MKTVLSILLLCSVSVQPLFGFTVLSLPNTGFFEITAANFGSPEEQEAMTRRRDSSARDSEYVETRFKDNEKTKADMALIEATISLLKPFHLDEIEAILGTRQPIPENSLLPAAFHYGGLTVSAYQNAGESTGAFFPLGDIGGVYVFQFTNRKTISAGAVYLKCHHSYQMDDRKSEAREAARELERPELEAIKAALEKKVAGKSSE